MSGALSAAVARGALVAAVLDDAGVAVAEFDVRHFDGIRIQAAGRIEGMFDRAREALGLGGESVTVRNTLVYARGDWQGIRVVIYADARDAGYVSCSCGCCPVPPDQPGRTVSGVLSAAVARGALVAAVLDDAGVDIAGFDVANPALRGGVKVHVFVHGDPSGFDRAREALGFGGETVTVRNTIVYARGDWQGIRVEIYANARKAGYVSCSCGCCRSGS